MTPEEVDAELEEQRIRNCGPAQGEASAPADVQATGTGRKARRSRRGVQDPQSLAEMVGASPSKDSVALPAVADLLDQGRASDQRGSGSDVSIPSENVDRPLSFLALLGNVKFNAEGETVITLESMYDLAEIVKLKDYRHQILRIEVHRA